mgnify:FL=1
MSENEIPSADRLSLWEIAIRGQLAAGMMEAGVTPTPKEWNVLNGAAQLTPGVAAEMANAAGFEIQLVLKPARKEVAA